MPQLIDELSQFNSLLVVNCKHKSQAVAKQIYEEEKNM